MVPGTRWRREAVLALRGAAPRFCSPGRMGGSRVRPRPCLGWCSISARLVLYTEFWYFYDLSFAGLLWSVSGLICSGLVWSGLFLFCLVGWVCWCRQRLFDRLFLLRKLAGVCASDEAWRSSLLVSACPWGGLFSFETSCRNGWLTDCGKLEAAVQASSPSLVLRKLLYIDASNMVRCCLSALPLTVRRTHRFNSIHHVVSCCIMLYHAVVCRINNSC